MSELVLYIYVSKTVYICRNNISVNIKRVLRTITNTYTHRTHGDRLTELLE